MKVLFVEPEASGHRMALYGKLLLECFREQGWTVSILTSPRATEHPAFESVQKKADGTSVVHLMRDVTEPKWPNAAALLKNQMEYFRSVKLAYRQLPHAERPDIVYVNTLDYFDKVLAIRGSPFGATPFAGMMMDVKYHRKTLGIGAATRNDALYSWLFRRVLRIPTLRRVAVIDEAFAAFISALEAPEYDKVAYVPDVGLVSGSECSWHSRETLGIPRRAFVILVYGSLSRRKGIGSLLQTIESKDIPDDITVVLAGMQDDYVRDLLSTSSARRLRATKRLVTLPGFLSDPEQYRAFNVADVVWLGYTDGFCGSSGVLYQAGSMGLPVITSESGLLGWLNGRHEVGLSLNPEDSASVARAIRKLRSDKVLRRKLGNNGRTLASRHSPAAFQKEIAKLLGGN